MRKKLKLGLFGFGCVGQGLYHVLHETHGGVQAEIKKICVKNKNKERILPEHFFTFDKQEILNDPEIDVIVELIDDAKAAYEIVKTSLQNGKSSSDCKQENARRTPGRNLQPPEKIQQASDLRRSRYAEVSQSLETWKNIMTTI